MVAFFGCSDGDSTPADAPQENLPDTPVEVGDDTPTDSPPDSPTDDSPPDSPDAGCPRIWYVREGMTAVVADGAMTLSSMCSECYFGVSQLGDLTGDFVVELFAENFRGGDRDWFQFNPPVDAFWGSWSLGPDGLPDTVEIYDGTQVDIVFSNDTSAVFRLELVGDQMTYTIDPGAAGGEVATLTRTMTAPNGSFGFGLDNREGLTPTPSIRFTELRVTGGGGDIVSDTFDCDSIVRP